MLLVAALLVAGAATAQDNKKKEPKDWAKFGYYEKANAEIADRVGKIDAVFMGNSITRGWVRHDAEFFDKNNFVGRGISGQTTAEMLVRFRQDVLDLKPRCVVILAGINDIAMKNIRRGISRVIAHRYAETKQVKVLFVGNICPGERLLVLGETSHEAPLCLENGNTAATVFFRYLGKSLPIWTNPRELREDALVVGHLFVHRLHVGKA